MRIACFPEERAEKNLCISSLGTHLHDNVSSHKIRSKILFFHCKGDQALTEAAQEGCGVSIHVGTQKLPRHTPGANHSK